MDIRLLKHTARNSFALMLIVIVISIVISKDNQSTIYANSSVNQMDFAGNQKKADINKVIDDSALIQGNTSIGDNNGITDESVGNKLGDTYLIINKLKHSIDNISIQDLYMERSIRVTITGLNEEIFNDDSLVRVIQGKKYTGISGTRFDGMIKTSNYGLNINERDKTTEAIMLPESEGTTDPVKGFSIHYSKEDDRLYTAIMDIQLDKIYASVLYQDDDNIYIDLKRPKDVYDKIIVVDAGHGGTDGGTYSEGEEYYEKNINLSLVLYLKELLDAEDIKVYYTRTTDQTVYLNPRVNLANEVEADFFISIHCNANESSAPGGSEVLYNELPGAEEFHAKQFANICLEELSGVTQKVNRGLVDGSEMIIIQKAMMPTALIEVAFMSNQDDLNFLLKEENGRRIAQALDKAIERAYEEIEP